MMRQLIGHHDGHGLAERMLVEADPIDPEAGAASHDYVVSLDGAQLARLHFWHEHPGVFESAIVEILRDRARCHLAGPLPCPQTVRILELLDEVIGLYKERADDRARRGVLGRNEP